MRRTRIAPLLTLSLGAWLVGLTGCGDHHHHHEVVVDVEHDDHPTKVRVDRDDREVIVERDRPARVSVSAEIIVDSEPPPPRVEVIPRSPGRDYVWVGGCWHHDGHRFVWVSGRYVRESKGERHVAAHWERSGRGWVFRAERVDRADNNHRDGRRDRDDDRHDDDRRRDVRRENSKQPRESRSNDDDRRRRNDDDDDRRNSGGETKRPR